MNATHHITHSDCLTRCRVQHRTMLPIDTTLAHVAVSQELLEATCPRCKAKVLARSLIRLDGTVLKTEPISPKKMQLWLSIKDRFGHPAPDPKGVDFVKGSVKDRNSDHYILKLRRVN